VQGLDASTGAVLGEVEVDGELAIRAVAPRGGSVALTAPRPSGAGVYEPESRSSTDITVADLERGRSHAYRLRGNFEPETFSTDESTLFLLEYWPPLEPDRYFVRQLDIETGAIADVDSPEVELNPEMRGRARAQVMDPDGTFLYTLYTLPRTGEPVYDPEATGDGARWAFVHALDLENEWATCIFLPLPFGQGAESSLNLAISTDGAHVVVADTSTGRLAAIDTGELAVTDTVPVEQLRGEPHLLLLDRVEPGRRRWRDPRRRGGVVVRPGQPGGSCADHRPRPVPRGRPAAPGGEQRDRGRRHLDLEGHEPAGHADRAPDRAAGSPGWHAGVGPAGVRVLMWALHRVAGNAWTSPIPAP
jgi:hypothetical protein